MRKVPVVIYGAGGQGRVVLDIFRARGREDVLGFFDSDPTRTGELLDGLPILGGLTEAVELHRRNPEVQVVVAIGDNVARQRVSAELKAAGFFFANAIHPQAFVSSSASLGRNVTIAVGAIICAHARVDDNVIVNTGAIVEHEDRIEDNVHLAPGVKLAGRVHVKQNAFIGIGATVIENLTVGEHVVVGAGAVVIDDVEPWATVVGAPAHAVKRRC